MSVQEKADLRRSAVLCGVSAVLNKHCTAVTYWEIVNYEDLVRCAVFLINPLYNRKSLSIQSLN